MAQMMNMQAREAAQQQQQFVPVHQQQVPAPPPEQPLQPPTSLALQPTQYMQAQVQQPPTQQRVVAPQVVDWSVQIADVMRNQFDLKPKEPAFMYHKPYPEAYDQIALPHRYRVPDFTKFSGQDGITTIKHIR